jgi:hypothetical protein
MGTAGFSSHALIVGDEYGVVINRTITATGRVVDATRVNGSTQKALKRPRAVNSVVGAEAGRRRFCH